MSRYRLSQLSDASLLESLSRLLADERSATALVLAHLAEADRRRLFVRSGYSSLYHFCVEKLGLSEHAAFRRSRAAVAVRRFPRLLERIADGRLHLSAVVELGPVLTAANFDELVEACARRTGFEVREILARRFPRPDCPPLASPIGKAGGPLERSAPGVDPLAPGRFAVQFTIGPAAWELLREARALLSHQIVNGDIGAVFERGLEVLVERLRRQKFGRASGQPRPDSPNPRYISPAVRHAVRMRDRARCTFVAADGRRCGSRDRLEYDHIVPVASGGRSTLENLRLRCRTHNQHTAELAFGAAFMDLCRRGEAKPA